MSLNRGVKHFVLTLERGAFSIARAREVIPHHTYEIVQAPRPIHEIIILHPFLYCINTPQTGLDLVETLEKKSIPE